MALITTIQEIKEVLPKLVSNLSANTLLPNFDNTEYKYIVPLIGATLYETLLTNYGATTLDADELILVKKIRAVVAPYAYYDDIGLYILTIADSGVKKVTSGTAEPVRGWESQQLKDTLIKKATDAVDVMLRWLFDNKALFPEWTASDEYKKINSLLVKTGTDFNNNYTLYQPQRTYFILKSVMTDVQRLFIQEDIGKDLLEYLRDTVDPEDEEIVCIELLKKALCFYTVMKGANHFSVSFSDNGYTILGEQNSNPLEQQANQANDLKKLEMKIAECEKEGDSYLELAKFELVKYYKGTAGVNFKSALDAGPLAGYVQPEDRTSPNEGRKIYSLP